MGKNKGMCLKIKYFLSSLHYLDLFQQNISLKIKSRYRVSLLIGKLLSIAIIIFMLYNALNSNMIKKVNPIVLQQLLKSVSRPKINLTPDNFLFAFGIGNDSSYYSYDPTFYTIEIIQSLYRKGEFVEKKNIEFDPCNENNFKNFPGAFKSVIPENLSCIKNTNVTLEGYWDEDFLRFFSIYIKKCVNTTESANCKSEEEINEFFKIKYFGAFLIQQSFNLNDFQNPYSSGLKNIYTGVEIGRRKEVSDYLKKTKILTDSQALFSSYDEIDTYTYEEGAIDFQNSDDTLMVYNLYSSDYTMVFQRRYEKLFDVLATLGGILNPFLIIGSIIVKFVNDWKINELIMNKIYSLNNTNDCEENNSKIFKVDKKFELQGYLKLTFLEKIKYFLKPKRCFTQKETIYHTYLKKSNTKLDLFEVIKKLEEIEKLKNVFFNENQRKIFDYFSKQLIFTNNKNSNHIRFALDEKKRDTPQAKKIMKILKRISLNKQASEIDKKLIKLIKGDLQKKVLF